MSPGRGSPTDDETRASGGRRRWLRFRSVRSAEADLHVRSGRQHADRGRWRRGRSHLLNTSDNAVTTTLHLKLDTIPPAQVTAKLAPARISYHDLKIAPSAKSAFTEECDLAAAYDGLYHRPLAYKLYYTLSHYHKL